MQYLISIYFDEKTDKIFRGYMERAASKSGNTFMIEHQVPPHITVSAFEAENESAVVEAVENCVKELRGGTLQWVTVGALPSGVLYIAPVLNAYLHRMTEMLYDGVRSLGDVRINKLYQPFQWMPHTTIAKKMTEEEMMAGFQALQTAFVCREGKAVKIGLATQQPYREIREWRL